MRLAAGTTSFNQGFGGFPHGGPGFGASGSQAGASVSCKIDKMTFC